jgi:hypothetical protein
MTRTLAETAALVIEHHQALEHDGVLVDAQTARAITLVYNALSPTGKEKFNALPAATAGAAAWRLVTRKT